MNEWHVNFSWEKKKNTKKKHTHLGKKKTETHPKTEVLIVRFVFILVRFRQVAPTQPNTTNLKTVWVVAQLGAGVTIFERHYRVVLTARDSNRWHQPGEFCRTVELQFGGN